MPKGINLNNFNAESKHGRAPPVGRLPPKPQYGDTPSPPSCGRREIFNSRRSHNSILKLDRSQVQAPLVVSSPRKSAPWGARPGKDSDMGRDKNIITPIYQTLTKIRRRERKKEKKNVKLY